MCACELKKNKKKYTCIYIYIYILKRCSVFGKSSQNGSNDQEDEEDEFKRRMQIRDGDVRAYRFGPECPRRRCPDDCRGRWQDKRFINLMQQEVGICTVLVVCFYVNG